LRLSRYVARIRRLESREGSPFRLFLGKASVVYAKQRSQELYRDAVTWEDISNVVDYPEVPEENFKT
jgi:hypothetical protein